MNNIQQTEHGNYLALDPQMARKDCSKIYINKIEKVSFEYDLYRHFMFTNDLHVCETIN